MQYYERQNAVTHGSQVRWDLFTAAEETLILKMNYDKFTANYYILPQLSVICMNIFTLCNILSLTIP